MALCWGGRSSEVARGRLRSSMHCDTKGVVMTRQTAISTVQHRTATRFAWALWAIYLLLQTAAFIVAFLVRSYPERAETLPLFSRILLFLPFSFAFPTVGALIA